MNYIDIDFEQIWQSSISNKEGYAKDRALNDNVEKIFWERLAPVYDNTPSLYDYSKEVFNFINHLIVDNKTLLEIGAGTGKFTIPLSLKCKTVFANDFSKDMLKIIDNKTKELNINNIELVEGKWEDITVCKNDYILSVNSLYRVWNIKDALLKMNKLAKDKVIIVRTIQKPLFNKLYMDLGYEDKTCLDYIFLPNILNALKIYADIKFIDVENEVEFNTLEDIYSKIEIELNRKIDKNEKINHFIKRNLLNQNGRFIFTHKTKVAIIYWTPIK